jgi:hypothetical protein
MFRAMAVVRGADEVFPSDDANDMVAIVDNA